MTNFKKRYNTGHTDLPSAIQTLMAGLALDHQIMQVYMPALKCVMNDYFRLKELENDRSV